MDGILNYFEDLNVSYFAAICYKIICVFCVSAVIKAWYAYDVINKANQERDVIIQDAIEKEKNVKLRVVCAQRTIHYLKKNILILESRKDQISEEILRYRTNYEETKNTFEREQNALIRIQDELLEERRSLTRVRRSIGTASRREKEIISNIVALENVSRDGTISISTIRAVLTSLVARSKADNLSYSCSATRNGGFAIGIAASLLTGSSSFGENIAKTGDWIADDIDRQARQEYDWSRLTHHTDTVYSDKNGARTLLVLFKQIIGNYSITKKGYREILNLTKQDATHRVPAEALAAAGAGN